jgi:hypothetical protein
MIAVLSRILLVASLACLAPRYAFFAANSSTGCTVTKPNGQAPLGQPHGSETYGTMPCPRLSPPTVLSNSVQEGRAPSSRTAL